jgi:hypothetical protein
MNKLNDMRNRRNALEVARDELIRYIKQLHNKIALARNQGKTLKFKVK